MAEYQKPPEKVLLEDTYPFYWGKEVVEDIRLTVTSRRLRVCGVRTRGLLFQERLPVELLDLDLGQVEEASWSWDRGFFMPPSGFAKLLLNGSPRPLIIATSNPDLVARAIQKASGQLKREGRPDGL